MAEFKVVYKNIGGMRGLNEKHLHEIEQNITNFLNEGWKVINSSFEGVMMLVSLVKE